MDFSGGERIFFAWSCGVRAFKREKNIIPPKLNTGAVALLAAHHEFFCHFHFQRIREYFCLLQTFLYISYITTSCSARKLTQTVCCILRLWFAFILFLAVCVSLTRYSYEMTAEPLPSATKKRIKGRIYFMLLSFDLQ